MSALPFAQIQNSPDAIIVSNGNHLAAVAATRTSCDEREIEQLPFDLSALEEEGIFINVDAAGLRHPRSASDRAFTPEIATENTEITELFSGFSP